MKRIILLLLLFSNYLTAQQWQPTSIRQRFVNGIGIPTRDTFPGTLSDSSQLVLRPQDSVIYFKYKGYWRALGGGAAAFTSTLQHEVKAGEAITKGQAVYVTSADGTNMVVSKASNATEATSSKTLGLIASTLSTNGKGYVITEGLLAGLNTSTATAGDAVWLGTGGNLIYGLTNKPTAPAHLVFIGIVTRSNSSNGEIFVKPQNGFELNEIHDVAINSPRNQSILLYDSTNKLWRDTLASVITANKVSYTDTAAMLSPYLRSNVATATYEPKITAGTTAQYWRGDKSWQTLPVYTLAGLGGQPQLNGTGFVKASGTTISYDNSSYYLASNPNGYTSNTGTVTSIATTAPLTGGTITTSGTLGITQATTSTSGFLSSTDWNTFNGKQSALTNPTTGTGTTNYVTKWTGASTLGNSQLFDNGTNVGIGTTSPAVRFHVNSGGTGSNSFSAFFTDNSANQNGLAFSHLNGTSRIYATYNSTASDQGLAFWTSLSNGAQFERLSINANGNVGIGTTSPAEKLSVAGRLLVNTNTTDGANALQVNGSAKISSLAGTGERLVGVDASGKLVVSTSAAGTISGGSYVTTYTAISNVTNVGATGMNYTIVGNVVTVFGRINITSTDVNQVSQIDMTVPTSVLTGATSYVGGAGTEIASNGTRTQGTLGFSESPTTDLIRIVCKPMVAGILVQYRFSFSYIINTSS